MIFSVVNFILVKSHEKDNTQALGFGDFSQVNKSTFVVSLFTKSQLKSKACFKSSKTRY